MGISNNGLAFEQLIESANRVYENKGWAIIQKIPTPVKVFRLMRGRIRDGVFDRKSTVDFIGVSHGKPIAFDAKSTLERTSYPLQDKVHQHQMDYLQTWQDQGGVAFFLLQWIKHDEIYRIPYDAMKEYWDDYLGDGRKSIPYKDMVQFKQVRSGKGITVHYLDGLEV